MKKSQLQYMGVKKLLSKQYGVKTENILEIKTLKMKDEPDRAYVMSVARQREVVVVCDQEGTRIYELHSNYPHPKPDRSEEDKDEELMAG